MQAEVSLTSAEESKLKTMFEMLYFNKLLVSGKTVYEFIRVTFIPFNLQDVEGLCLINQD